MIEEQSEFWPNRRLETMERKYLLAKIIKHTSEDISKTLHPEQQTQSKTMDSRLITKFLDTKQDEKEIEDFFLAIGLHIRKLLTSNSNRPLLGLIPIEDNFIVDINPD